MIIKRKIFNQLCLNHGIGEQKKLNAPMLFSIKVVVVHVGHLLPQDFYKTDFVFKVMEL